MRTTFSVRFDEELTNKIDSTRGEKSRTNFIQDILVKYFDEPHFNQHEPQSDARSEPHVDLDEAELVPILKDEIDYLRKQNSELIRLVNQEQVIHLHSVRQLPEKASEAHEQKEKNWWKFWKK
jgi:hypothetical protein